MSVKNSTTAKATKVSTKRTYNRTAERFNLENAQPGDKIKTEVDGKKVTAVLLYCKASARHPQGRCYLEYQGKVIKRRLDAVIVPDTLPKGKGLGA